MANETKQWYQSKTIIASAIAVLAVLAGYFGVDIVAGEQAKLVELITTIIATIGGLIAMYGRVTAKKDIK